MEDAERREAFEARARERATRRFGSQRVTRDLEAEYLRLIGEWEDSCAEEDISLSLFEAEYRERLRRSFGGPSMSYRLERLAWRGISDVLPVWRYPAYHLLRFRSLPN